MKILLTILITTALLGGCKSTPPMYEYENYSSSFYSLKKDGDEQSTATWKTSLEEIITESKMKAVRVPPGIYANLGYIQLKSNNPEGAIKYFEQEKAIYPEAVKFMDRLIQKAQAKG